MEQKMKVVVSNLIPRLEKAVMYPINIHIPLVSNCGYLRMKKKNAIFSFLHYFLMALMLLGHEYY